MKPYYQDESVTLFHADCRDLLSWVGSFDLVLTDPPYGIAGVWKGGNGHGWGNADVLKDTRNGWDQEAPSSDTLKSVIAKASHAVIWGGNYFDLPPSRGWFVWNKPERGFTLSEAELAWTTRDSVIRVKDLPRSEPGREHPTEKPEALMIWCLGHFPDALSVFDPFAGSGSTLVAAKRLGRTAIGIEAYEPYCEMAANRLRQGTLSEMFASPVAPQEQK